jgi:predicted alpha/beta-fold hydrolase
MLDSVGTPIGTMQSLLGHSTPEITREIYLHAITARYCGFQGADDYYARSSAMHVLHSIQRPTLVLAARDDPFVPVSIFRHPALHENPCITFLETRHGGHCGFISQEAGEERFWAEARVTEFFVRQSKMKA